MKPASALFLMIMIMVFSGHMAAQTPGQGGGSLSLKMITPPTPNLSDHDLDHHLKLKAISTFRTTLAGTIPLPFFSKRIFQLAPDPGPYFFAVQFDIGNPPYRAVMVFDTMTPFTWVKAHYNPKNSTSFYPMPASSEQCVPPLFNSSSSTSPPNGCDYDFGFSQGSYGYDQFDGVSLMPIPFGVQVAGDGRADQYGVSVDGVLGLGAGHPASFLSNSHLFTFGRFSFCMPSNFDGPRRSTPTLTFGPFARFGGSGGGIQTIPIIRSPAAGRDLYYLNLTNIYVQGRSLPINPDLFQPSRGGFTVGTGSPYSLFAEEAYQHLKQAVIKYYADHYGLQPQPVDKYKLSFDLCYQIMPGQVYSRPYIGLGFQGGAQKLKLWRSATFAEFKDDNLFCFLIQPLPAENATSVLGFRQQVGHRFLFDVAASHLSFRTEPC